MADEAKAGNGTGGTFPSREHQFGVGRPQPDFATRRRRGPTSLLKRMERMLDRPVPADVLRRLLREPAPEGAPPVTWRGLMATSALENYCRGNQAMVKELHARWFGPLPETLDLEVRDRRRIVLRDVPIDMTALPCQPDPDPAAPPACAEDDELDEDERAELAQQGTAQPRQDGGQG